MSERKKKKRKEDKKHKSTEWDYVPACCCSELRGEEPHAERKGLFMLRMVPFTPLSFSSSILLHSSHILPLTPHTLLARSSNSRTH